MKSLAFSLSIFTLLFSACNPNTEPAKQKSENTIAPRPVTTCYLLKFEKDINAFELTLNPDSSAKGYLAWEPFEKDGGRGWFEGKRAGDFLTGDFTYMIEGAVQTEEVVFKFKEQDLTKGRGGLDVSGDRLTIIDKSSLVFEDIYKRVDCKAIGEPIARAKEVSEIIQAQRARRYESLTGKYEYDLGEDRGSGELLVKQLENNQVRISFNIVSHAPAFNQGSGEGILNLDENLNGDYRVEEFGGDCLIRFSFRGNKVICEQLAGDSADCGFGNNVRAQGEFMKSSSEDPFVQEPEN